MELLQEEAVDVCKIFSNLTSSLLECGYEYCYEEHPETADELMCLDEAANVLEKLEALAILARSLPELDEFNEAERKMIKKSSQETKNICEFFTDMNELLLYYGYLYIEEHPDHDIEAVDCLPQILDVLEKQLEIFKPKKLMQMSKRPLERPEMSPRELKELNETVPTLFEPTKRPIWGRSNVPIPPRYPEHTLLQPPPRPDETHLDARKKIIRSLINDKVKEWFEMHPNMTDKQFDDFYKRWNVWWELETNVRDDSFEAPEATPRRRQANRNQSVTDWLKDNPNFPTRALIKQAKLDRREEDLCFDLAEGSNNESLDGFSRGESNKIKVTRGHQKLDSGSPLITSSSSEGE